MLDATHLLRFYAARRLRRLATVLPMEAQESQLRRLLSRARSTPFGRRHDFARLRSVADFQNAVPLRRYDDFWREFWQASFPNFAGLTWPGPIPYLAVTSGTTTGRNKYIPVSREMLAANRRAAFDVLTHHMANRPGSRLLGGRNFVLGGSMALTREAPGIWSGDLSGIAATEVPFWARPRYFPPPREALVADWETKIATLAGLSLQADIRSISGTPSWLLVFFEKLAQCRPDAPRRLASYYPDLELLVHGAVNFAPYRRSFEELLAGSRAELREVYPASEGFIAIADRGPDQGLRLLLDNGIFYEFVPVEELDSERPVRHWIGSAEPGINYALVLTTCAGLWSYVLGDTVKLIDKSPPRLLITGRTTYFLSAFGEHLIAEEIERAVAAAAAAIESAVNDYVVAPVYPERGGEQRGGHLFVVEFAGPSPSTSAVAGFAGMLDQSLIAANEDYAARRSTGAGMRPPKIRVVRTGGFAGWMKARGRLGGQHKVPRIINDPELLRDLMAFLDQSPGGRPP
jgi:hypothetical protein